VGSDTYTLIKGPGKGLVEYAEKMQAKDTLGLTRREFDVKDKVITLSTCTGNEATRYVVQAVKIEP
jgi:sortase B